MKEPGCLYMIASPLGNLQDITLRALEILQLVDVIYCEDTRQTKKILQSHGITALTRSWHANSSDKKITEVLNLLAEGKKIAYLTDAGTPGVSDPGSKLVQAAGANNFLVCPLPGPSALTALVSVSGYLGRRIFFLGFLSKKEGKRKKELEEFKNHEGLLVVYESPYRVIKLLKLIVEVFPEQEIIIGREMTKIFEEFWRGKGEALLEKIDKITQKGEFTLGILNYLKKEN